MTPAPETLPPQPPTEHASAYDRYGPDVPRGPVIISVPHAGRDYPNTMLANARCALAGFRRLEDRYADLLTHRLIALGHSVFVARTPRAVIDLNRDVREIDPAMVRGLPRDQPLIASAKLRGGLGLVPRRLQGIGDLWIAPFDWADLSARMSRLHAPYHEALARMMARARDIHGHAILLDIHSMPPLISGTPPAQVVLGDRFGRSASTRLVALAADLCAGHGLVATQNHPYPGNYILERHGRPDSGFHALQLEIDRSLYLDSTLDQPGPGLSRIQGLVVDLVDALGIELPGAFAQAAE
ncbi:MAG TPA: N-formylglutamate amidohydrolase [Sphingobium sp.]